MNGETAKLCSAAGVDVAVAGSYVYYAEDIKAAIDSIKKSIRGTKMEVVIILGGPNTKEDIKALLENRYGKAYEDFRFVGVDGGALRLLDQHLPMEVAIGDFDSVTNEQRDLIHEAAGTVIQLPSEKRRY